jgi:hypothetical protein
MNPSPLAYHASTARNGELYESADRSRRHRPIASTLAAAAVRPPSERRGAVRAALTALLSR